jgi:hypothetical protein
VPLTNSHYQTKNAEWLLAASPAGTDRRNIPRLGLGSDSAALATGVLKLAAIALVEGDVVSTVSLKSGATAAVTPLNQLVGLYSAAGVLLAASADATTAAWAANTVKSFSMTAPYVVPQAGVYYVGILVVATTAPTLIGMTLALAGSAQPLTTDKAMAATYGSAQTTLPTTGVTFAAAATIPYVVVN